MQFQPNQAFNHPVLRPQQNGGEWADFPRFGFETILTDPEVDRSMQRISFSLTFVCSHPGIVAEIARGAASYGVVIYCRRTLYRRLIRSEVDEMRIDIGWRDVGGAVDIRPCVFATKRLGQYRPQGQHPEFRDGTYVVSEGAPLSLDFTKSFRTDLDPRRRLTSVFRWVPDPSKRSGEFDVLIDDVVKILVNPEDRHRIMLAQGTRRGRSSLTNDIFVPVVMVLLQEAVNLGEEGRGLKWFDTLTQRLEQLNNEHSKVPIDLESISGGTPSLWWTAQAVFEFPGRELEVLGDDLG